MMNKQKLYKLERAAQLLKVMAHPVRLEIVTILLKEERLSVGDIQNKLGITQSMTSQHLAALKNIEVIACDKEANICYYRILNKNIFKLLNCVENCAR